MPLDDRLESERCSEFLKAIADPERLKIVQCLETGPKAVGEIAKLLQTADANASHHLRVLKNAGLVDREKQGRSVVYSLSLKHFVPKNKRQPLDILDFGCCRLELGRLDRAGKPNEGS